MAWQDELVPTLRFLVNDPDAATYSDARLEQVLATGARLVSAELGLSAYTVSVADSTISPDPTLPATRDDAFANLLTLKSACLVDRGVAIVAANRALYVKDGSSAIDLRGVAAAKQRLLERGGWCSAYEQEKLAYQNGVAGMAGALVLTPFRLYLNGLGE